MLLVTDQFIGPAFRVYAPKPTPFLNRSSIIRILTAALIPLLWIAPFPAGTTTAARLTLMVFAVAVWMWVFSKISDTYVALGAASALVLLGIINVDSMFAPLGDDTIWLLIGAFIIAGAVTQSGLATRVAIRISAGVTSARALIHILTFATVLTAFAVPATSGRAALILPVFLAFTAVLPPWLLRILAITLPSVVLFSAVASLIGAGAHLITVQILESQQLAGFSFTKWLVLGLPFALVTSHFAAEIILRALSSGEQRSERLSITAAQLNAGQPLAPMTGIEVRSLIILAITVGLWFSESIHHIPAAMVAVVGALLMSAPKIGTVDIGESLKKIPWSLLVFMAATIAISHALSESGAAEILAHSVLGGLNASTFVLAIIVLSTAAHLLIQSRSARSAVLIPLVVVLAPTVGVNPVAAAFISTAAAGFCHTLPASAKPLAIFRGIDETVGTTHFDAHDLTRIAAFLAPMFIVVTTVFAFIIWPALGLPLFQ